MIPTSAAEMELVNDVATAAARENFNKWWNEDRAAEINERWRIKRKFLDAKGDDPSLASKYVVLDVLANLGDHKKIPELLKDQIEKRNQCEDNESNETDMVSFKGCNYLSTENVCKTLAMPEFNMFNKVVMGEGIEADDTKDIAELIRSSKTISSLDLSNNKIETEGLKTILDAMSENTTITSLDVSCCSLGSSAGKPLATYLATNPPLQRLLLNGNKLGIHGTEDLARGLEHNTKLTTLGLFFNTIGEEGANHLYDLLRDTSEPPPEESPANDAESNETPSLSSNDGEPTAVEEPEAKPDEKPPDEAAATTSNHDSKPEAKSDEKAAEKPPDEADNKQAAKEEDEPPRPPKPREAKNKTLLQIELTDNKCSIEILQKIEALLEQNNADARQLEIEEFKKQQLARMQEEEKQKQAEEAAIAKAAKPAAKGATKPAAKGAAKPAAKTAKPSPKTAAKPAGKASKPTSSLPAIKKK
eukprot:TRINITY_DN22406_c0_g1_i1.p1 TRINITY_DN22406_c0_g1~~TRINITY_DN22406_c0_g1_i1.p1  ORF type:complete len:474 (+),score=132.02 TRINITY_DN22406_c0_g1_i1:48-1469(+)